MPHLTQTLDAGTAAIKLHVSVSEARRSALTEAGQPIPGWQTADAIIDTGASCTCIDPTILNPLGLAPTGITLMDTPSTGGKAHQCFQYDVMLAIYHPMTSKIIGTIPVVAPSLAPLGFTALIGRDVLQACLFILDGSAGTFTLAF